MTRIVEVGSLNMDLVVHMPAIPKPGETLLGGVFRTFPGGKGANQAVAAARLGGRVSMVGCVGGDTFGRELRNVLELEDINTTFIKIDPDQATGVALIIVDAHGNNSIAVASGANFSLTAGDIQSAWQNLAAVDWLVMPLETPPETISTAVTLAKQSGAGIILNPAPARELEAGLLSKIDVFVPNEHETAFYTGITPVDDESADRAALRLLQFGVRNAVLTLGSRGALVVEATGDQPKRTMIPAFEVPVVDTTAAGDAFVGGLVVALSEGRSLVQAARFASAAAALSVTQPGAQPSLPARQAVDRFLIERSQ
ncbi:MAG: ribokinase [Bellilinea sp.]|jgi:ribokinase